jgi:hypothetical protein
MSRLLVLAVILIFLSSFTLSADGKEDVFARKNKIGFQIGGSSLIFGGNYERILLNYNRYKTGVEIGAGLLSFNTGINQLFSFNQHHIELKMGAILATMIYSDSIYYSLGVGYRFQKPLGRITFQVTCPIYFGENAGFFVGAGVSISRVF